MGTTPNADAIENMNDVVVKDKGTEVDGLANYV